MLLYSVTFYVISHCNSSYRLQETHAGCFNSFPILCLWHPCFTSLRNGWLRQHIMHLCCISGVLTLITNYCITLYCVPTVLKIFEFCCIVISAFSLTLTAFFFQGLKITPVASKISCLSILGGGVSVHVPTRLIQDCSVFKVTPSARCISAAYIIFMDIDIFNEECMLLVDSFI